MDDQKYTNPFLDVFRKAKDLKDRAREASKNDAEVRESRLMQEVKELRILDKKPD